MSDISELEGRLTAALERIARGVDGMQAAVAEPDEGEDVQALRRALENEALVTAQMEERVRALTARQTELEEELGAAQGAKTDAEDALKTAESQAEDTSAALLTAEARAEAAETAAAAAADAAEAAVEAADVAVPAEDAPAQDEAAAEAAEQNRVMLAELGKRLRRLRQMARRERSANHVLREQVEKDGMVDPSAVNGALKADLDTLSALREAESAETAVILEELRPLVHGVAVAAPEADLDDTGAAPEEIAVEAAEPLADKVDDNKETGDA
jgi:DNA repair exonuclease SbcCD ATPase subunit